MDELWRRLLGDGYAEQLEAEAELREDPEVYPYEDQVRDYGLDLGLLEERAGLPRSQGGDRSIYDAWSKAANEGKSGEFWKRLPGWGSK